LSTQLALVARKDLIKDISRESKLYLCKDQVDDMYLAFFFILLLLHCFIVATLSLSLSMLKSPICTTHSENETFVG